MRKSFGFVACALSLTILAGADQPDDDSSWNDVVSKGESLVFGRFVGKFESTDFRSRRVRLREVNTGDDEVLEIDEGLGYITETIPPGVYDVVGFEAVYFPPAGRPLRPEKYRPIRQRFAVKPKTGDSTSATIHVPKDRPVYIGTIRADNSLDGVVYRGHQVRVIDEFDASFERLASFYPTLAASMERDGIVPARHFMLRPSRPPDPLERVVGLDDPIKQAREYIGDGKYDQAIRWLETFMPASDAERNEAKLLVGEALLGARKYPEAIEELGEALLTDPHETRALRLLARAHALEGHLDDAQSLYRGLAEMIPDDAEAHLHLGYLYALKNDGQGAEAEFSAAFQTDFDYLLHDLVPFFVVVREVFEKESSGYVPPRVVKYSVPPPSGMDSRRSAENSGFSVLIDHQGKVIAAQIGSQSSGSTPLMMLSLVHAKYEPASLNGIPIPALVTMGGSESAGQ